MTSSRLTHLSIQTSSTSSNRSLTLLPTDNYTDYNVSYILATATVPPHGTYQPPLEQTIPVSQQFHLRQEQLNRLSYARQRQSRLTHGQRLTIKTSQHNQYDVRSSMGGTLERNSRHQRRLDNHDMMDDSRNVDPDAPLTETAAAQMIASAVRQQREREAADIANSLAASIIQQSNTNNTVMLKPADVGYFDPSATDLSGRGVVSDGEVNRYSDIFPFCDRLTHLAVTHGEDAVRSVWSQCLLGPALVWHSHILRTS